MLGLLSGATAALAAGTAHTKTEGRRAAAPHNAALSLDNACSTTAPRAARLAETRAHLHNLWESGASASRIGRHVAHGNNACAISTCSTVLHKSPHPKDTRQEGHRVNNEEFNNAHLTCSVCSCCRFIFFFC